MSKRKRGKRKAVTAATEDKDRPVTEARINAAWGRVSRDITPRLFADTARRLGARGARPRDFKCGCAPSFLDGLPLCEGRKPGCAFAGRVAGERMDAHGAPAAEARYEALYDAALAARPPLT